MRISDWSSDVCSSDLLAIVLSCSTRSVKPIRLFVHLPSGRPSGRHFGRFGTRCRGAVFQRRLRHRLPRADPVLGPAPPCKLESSEESRVGKEVFIPFSYRWFTFH